MKIEELVQSGYEIKKTNLEPKINLTSRKQYFFQKVMPRQ